MSAIEAFEQVKHIKAAVALIEAAFNKPLIFAVPSYMDEHNRICWAVIVGENNRNDIIFVSTKYDSRLAGLQVSLNLIIAPPGRSKIRKLVTDSVGQILSKNQPKDIDQMYNSFAESVGIPQMSNVKNALDEIVRSQI